MAEVQHYSLRARLVLAGRQARLYDYRLVASNLEIGRTACLSALFRDDALRRRSRRMNGRVIHLHVRLYNYREQAAADPIGMTVSNMQNYCTGRYYVIIDSIER